MTCVLDTKTGSAQPWTALQVAAYSLLDTPVEFHEEGHIYTVGGAKLPSVTEILTAENFIDARFFTEESRERGSYVHLAVKLDNMGVLDEFTVDPMIFPYLDAWRRFRRESGFVIEQCEVPMASSIYKYGGTADCIGHFPSGTLRRAAVELHADGGYRLVPFTDKQDVPVWLSVLACYRWRINHGIKTA